MNKKKLSVIIVNYRSQRYLNDCLASFLGRFSGVDLEIIIVNNDPSEDFEEISSLFPMIKLVQNKENVGFGQGINSGLEKSSGEYLWFLNPDTVFFSGDLESVLGQLDDSSIGAVGAKLANHRGLVQPWIAGRRIDLVDIILSNLGLIRSQKIWESQEVVDCDWVSGGSFFIKRNTFLSLGGFDKNIFMYYEDADLCLRIRRSGLRILYWPYLVVRHIGGGSYLEKEKQKEQFYFSQDYYFRKNFGKIIAETVRVLRSIFTK